MICTTSSSLPSPGLESFQLPDSARLGWGGWDTDHSRSLAHFASRSSLLLLCNIYVLHVSNWKGSPSNKISSHRTRHALSKLTERKGSSSVLSLNLGKSYSGLKKKKETLQCCRPAMQHESAAGTWIKMRWRWFNSFRKWKGISIWNDATFHLVTLHTASVPLHLCPFMVLEC